MNNDSANPPFPVDLLGAGVSPPSYHGHDTQNLEDELDRPSSPRPPSYMTEFEGQEEFNEPGTPRAGTPEQRRVADNAAASSSTLPSQNSYYSSGEPIILRWEGEESSSQVQLPPPDYAPPKRFFIRDQRTRGPLVNTTQIRGHLSLLTTFLQLKKMVEEMDDPEMPFLAGMDKEERWCWLVGFAVDRFAVWCEALAEEDIGTTLEEITPPLDVLMVWHSYLLNPGWYAEDCERIACLGYLSRIGIRVFESSLEGELMSILHEPPSEFRKGYWNIKLPDRPFDLFDDAKQNQTKTIKCPNCRDVVHHPYLDVHGTGYLQRDFQATCSTPECHFIQNPITKHTLGARKLAEDLASKGGSSRTHVAGTLWTSNSGNDASQAQGLQRVFLRASSLQRPKDAKVDSINNDEATPSPSEEIVAQEGWVLSILKKYDFSLHQIVRTCAAELHGVYQNADERIMATARRIFAAYATGDLFSVDLVGAVLRQSLFTQQMDDLGWCKAHFLDLEYEAILHQAVTRYHAFLDLAASSPASALLVPTLDIDLAWHTHQLLGRTYHEHCKQYVRRHFDHLDKVEENYLSDAFEETRRAWKARFELPYTFCGCSVSGGSLWSKIGPGSGQDLYTTTQYLLHHDSMRPPAVETEREVFCRKATHPSDHNSIFDNRRNAISDNKRLTKSKKRAEKQSRGKGISFLKSKKTSTDLFPFDDDHEPAFLKPIPEWFFDSKGGYTKFAASMADRHSVVQDAKLPVQLKRYSDWCG